MYVKNDSFLTNSKKDIHLQLIDLDLTDVIFKRMLNWIFWVGM